MNLENVRSSFEIHVIDNNEDRNTVILKSLKSRDFKGRPLADTKSSMNILRENPPHIIFLEFQTFGDGEKSFISQVNKISPETRIILMTDREHFSDAYTFFEFGVFDFIFSDFFMKDEFEKDQKLALSNILKSADHAVEMDFYKFKNEQLESETQQIKKVKDAGTGFTLHNVWLRQLGKCRSFSSSVDCFLGEMSRYLDKAPACYLKYVSAYKSLVTSRSLNFPAFKVGEALSLKNMMDQDHIDEANFESSQAFKALIHERMSWEKISVLPLRINGELKGVFIFRSDSEREGDSFVLACLNSLALKVSNIVLERRLHTVNNIDEDTGVYTRKYLFSRLNEEISRARRIYIPTSFVLVSVDRFAHIIDGASKFEIDKVLRMMASLVQKSSRVNDIVGRISSDEFGLILSHTPYDGALIKAERIRQLVENADFSLVCPEIKKVTISIGVSEYPSHCRDSDDMLEQADRAMVEVSQFGGNQVCLSSVASDFVPDFNYSR